MYGSTDITFSPGQIYRRRELHERFGGQRQGGISTPAKAPFFFLITGESGKQHGYSDKWTDQGVFLYMGEGQHGDMRFVGENREIRDHLKNGKALQFLSRIRRISDSFSTLERWNAPITRIGISPIPKAENEKQLYSTSGRSVHSRRIQPL